MAKLLLLSSNIVTGAVTRTKAALESLGHVVTFVDDVNLAGVDFTLYDAVVTTVLDAGILEGTSATLRTQIDAGKPMLISLIDSGMSAGTLYTTTAAARLRFVDGAIAVSSSAANSDRFNLLDNTHPVTNGWAATGAQIVNASGNWHAAASGAFIGTRLGDAVPTGIAGKPLLMAIPRNTLDLAGVAVNARIVLWGQIYGGQSDYTAGAVDMLGRAVTWVLTNPEPDTTITSGPSGTANVTDATFEFTSNQASATFQASLDGGAWTTVTSPVTLTDLARGEHTFAVRAVANGLTDPTPATRTWTIVSTLLLYADIDTDITFDALHFTRSGTLALETTIDTDIVFGQGDEDVPLDNPRLTLFPASALRTTGVSVVRWTLFDGLATYTYSINPRTMNSPWADVAVTADATTHGAILLTEGNFQPAVMTVEGAILDKAHYDALVQWKARRRRLILTDHFYRQMTVFITSFKPSPKRDLDRYWKHDYEMSFLVLSQPIDTPATATLPVNTVNP